MSSGDLFDANWISSTRAATKNRIAEFLYNARAKNQAEYDAKKASEVNEATEIALNIGNPDPSSGKTYVRINVGGMVRKIKKAFGYRPANTKNKVIELQRKLVTKERTVWKQIADVQNTTGPTLRTFTGLVDIDWSTSNGLPGVNVTIFNGNGQQQILMSGIQNANISGGDAGSTLNATLIISPFNNTIQYNYRVSKQFTETYEVYRLKWVSRYD